MKPQLQKCFYLYKYKLFFGIMTYPQYEQIRIPWEGTERTQEFRKVQRKATVFSLFFVWARNVPKGMELIMGLSSRRDTNVILVCNKTSSRLVVKRLKRKNKKKWKRQIKTFGDFLLAQLNMKVFLTLSVYSICREQIAYN